MTADSQAFGHDFVPARSKLEAVNRISALTHSPPESLGPGSKERKSVLVNLASGLSLTVDTAASKPQLGAEMAAALGVAWTPECWSTGQTITLEGLNRLLDGAQRRIAKQARDSQTLLFATTQVIPAAFVAARSKLEAVTRISALTHSPPESLGPGSKERKSVLANLASGLSLTVDTAASKPQLGAEMAAALGVAWTPECWSTGQTITLEGLNRLLRGSEDWLRHRQATIQPGLFDTPLAEAIALLEALADVLPEHMEGRNSVRQMLAAEYDQWAQDEWAGFYFEFCGLPALVNTFGGGPIRFANTRFDYSLACVWDLKLHGSLRGATPLNALDAVEAALSSGRGLGFIVLSGVTEYDEGSFRQWQRDLRLTQGKKPAKRQSPPKYERRSKVAFTPQRLEVFFLADRAALDRARERGAIKVLNQGRQVTGVPRRPKLALSLNEARAAGLLLCSRELRGGGESSVAVRVERTSIPALSIRAWDRYIDLRDLIKAAGLQTSEELWEHLERLDADATYEETLGHLESKARTWRGSDARFMHVHLDTLASVGMQSSPLAKTVARWAAERQRIRSREHAIELTQAEADLMAATSQSDIASAREAFGERLAPIDLLQLEAYIDQVTVTGSSTRSVSDLVSRLDYLRRKLARLPLEQGVIAATPSGQQMVNELFDLVSSTQFSGGLSVHSANQQRVSQLLHLLGFIPATDRLGLAGQVSRACLSHPAYQKLVLERAATCAQGLLHATGQPTLERAYQSVDQP